MSIASHPTLRVVVEPYETGFLAQCVDFDLVADGATVDQAMARFIRLLMKNVVVAHELGMEPFADMPPAPAEYGEKWRRSAFRIDHTVKTFRIPRFAIVKPSQSMPGEFFGQVEAAITSGNAA